MQSANLRDRHRRLPNQNLRTILAIGCGASISIHLSLIAGISHFWKPPAVIDEPVEITLVEPIASEEKLTVPTPIKLSSKPVSIPKPVVIKPAPKSASIPTPISIKPIPIPTIPPSIPLAIQPTKIISKPKPIAIASKPKITSLKPPSKQKQITRKLISPQILQPTSNPPFPADKFRPIDLPSAPIAVDKLPTNSHQSTKILSAPIDNTLAEFPPNKTDPISSNPTPNIPNTPSSLSPPLSETFADFPQPQYPPKAVKNPATGGNKGDTFTQHSQSNRPSNEGILAGNDDRSDRSSASDNNQNNLISKSEVSSGTTNKTIDDRKNTPLTANNSNSGAKNGRLECIQNCQIAKLQNLQDSDGGKDRLRIRITIDPDGILISAEVVKSSGNVQIDSVILDGIKQMKFKPMGKIIKGIIKANILV